MPLPTWGLNEHENADKDVRAPMNTMDRVTCNLALPTCGLNEHENADKDVRAPMNTMRRPFRKPLQPDVRDDRLGKK